MTTLVWDSSTAYDLYISLVVIFHPEEYGLRRAWAAGVRSRLPAEERELLGEALDLLLAPLGWIESLPAPRNGETVLNALAALPPRARLERLALAPSLPPALPPLLRDVATRGDWTNDDWQAARAAYHESGHRPPKKRRLTRLLALWSRADAVSDALLAALTHYHAEFFAEEERRIRPHLQAAMEEAAALARDRPLLATLNRLAQGVSFAAEPAAETLVMAPSFWITPLILLSDLGAGRRLFLYGARPDDLSLIPGQLIPDSLTNALKALAEPTRLRILHQISHAPQTATELSRRLRLRPPTVTHHLQTLRVAGLVRIAIEANGRRSYTARREAIEAQFALLQSFLDGASRGEDEEA